MKITRALFIIFAIIAFPFTIIYAQDEVVNEEAAQTTEDTASAEEPKIEIVVSQELIDKQVHAYKGNLKEIVAEAERNLKKIDGDINSATSEKEALEHLEKIKTLCAEGDFEEANKELGLAEKSAIDRSTKRLVREAGRDINKKMKAAGKGMKKIKVEENVGELGPKSEDKSEEPALQTEVKAEVKEKMDEPKPQGKVAPKPVKNICNTVVKQKKACSACNTQKSPCQSCQKTNFGPKNINNKSVAIKSSEISKSQVQKAERVSSDLEARRQKSLAEAEAKRQAGQRALVEARAKADRDLKMASANKAALEAKAKVELEKIASRRAADEAIRMAKIEADKANADSAEKARKIAAEAEAKRQADEKALIEAQARSKAAVEKASIESAQKAADEAASKARAEAEAMQKSLEASRESRAETTVPVDAATQAPVIDAPASAVRPISVQAFSKGPSDEISVLYRIAVDLYWGNKYDESKAKFEEIERRSPNYSRTLYYLDKIKKKLGK